MYVYIYIIDFIHQKSLAHVIGMIGEIIIIIGYANSVVLSVWNSDSLITTDSKVENPPFPPIKTADISNIIYYPSGINI